MLFKLRILVIQSNKNVYDTKISQIERKITYHDYNEKYITTQEFNNLKSENFAAKLKQGNLVTKPDIDDFL